MTINSASAGEVERAALEFWDAGVLLRTPPPPIDWIIDGIFPMQAHGDLFGPPGEGKSTFAMSLLLHLASGADQWFGKRITSGKIVLLGGERSGPDALSRDLHRVWKKGLDNGRLAGPKIHSPLFSWDRTDSKWMRTSYCLKLMERLQDIGPMLILLDTLQSCAMGDPVDYNQQYQLGTAVQQMGRELRCAILTVSHTNQASVKQTLDWRLNYLARSGGNGLPGAFRWISGLSRLRADDTLVKQMNLESQVHKKLVAFAVSKHNEMPEPAWSIFNPAIFEIMADGGLTLIADGEQVADRIQIDKFKPSKAGRHPILVRGGDDWD